MRCMLPPRFPYGDGRFGSTKFGPSPFPTDNTSYSLQIKAQHLISNTFPAKLPQPVFRHWWDPEKHLPGPKEYSDGRNPLVGIKKGHRILPGLLNWGTGFCPCTVMGAGYCKTKLSHDSPVSGIVLPLILIVRRNTKLAIVQGEHGKTGHVARNIRIIFRVELNTAQLSSPQNIGEPWPTWPFPGQPSWPLARAPRFVLRSPGSTRVRCTWVQPPHQKWGSLRITLCVSSLSQTSFEVPSAWSLVRPSLQPSGR